MALLVPNATVFASSFCVMVIELVAGRIIAADLGSSLYTWTSVIGIVMAGLALGNTLGGRLADRFAVRPTLATLFIAASAACVSISVANHLAGDVRILWMLSWPMRVAMHVSLVFFLPACLLGMISPVVAKMALDAGELAGRTIGNVYAWGAIGSILGTFATGFYLVSTFGTTAIVLGVAGVLAAIAIVYQVGSWKPWAWLGVVAGVAVLSTGSADAARILGEKLSLRLPEQADVLYATESRYSKIKILQTGDDPASRAMHLDTLLHSNIDLNHPLELNYSYEKVFAAITTRLYGDREQVDNLMIGGGGYVFPRYMEETYPGSVTDVVEIDPEVTRAARLYFGLAPETTIRSFHEDARVFVDRALHDKRGGGSVDLYDIIYVDAFNNHTVPFQLTTLEFVQNARELLEPGGAYLVNLIDSYGSGQFIGAVINTVQEAFPHVYVFVEGVPVDRQLSSRNTFVVVGATSPFDVTELEGGCTASCSIFQLSDEQRTSLERKSGGLVLTDEFAPVENLLASLVRSHSIDRAYGDWVGSIRKAFDEGEFERAVSLARDAVAVFPNSGDFTSDFANLQAELGIALRRNGDVDSAVVEFQQALELAPMNKRARLGLIDCYRDLEEFEQSLPLFEGMLEFDPHVRYNFATTLARLARYEEAVAQFELVTHEMPNFADAHNNWGTTLQLIGDRQGALEQFARAVEIEPEHGGARANLARVQASLEEVR